MYVGGSVASGADDEVSDLDLWIVGSQWRPEQLAGLLVSGSATPTETGCWFHGCDHTGLVVDLASGPTPPQGYKPVEAEPLPSQVQGNIEPQSLFTNFWLSSYKHRKPLLRNVEALAIFGLHFDRMALIRAWVETDTGAPVDNSAFTIHGLSPIARNHISPERQALLGLPARNRSEIVAAIVAYRQEMLRLAPEGSVLSSIVTEDPIFQRLAAAASN